MYYKNKGYTQKTFGGAIDMTQSQLCRLLQGKSKITKCHCMMLEKVFGVNPVWLESGCGRMFLQKAEQKNPDPKVSALMTNYEVLNEDYKEMLYVLSESLVKYQKSGLMPQSGDLLKRPELRSQK